MIATLGLMFASSLIHDKIILEVSSSLALRCSSSWPSRMAPPCTDTRDLCSSPSWARPSTPRSPSSSCVNFHATLSDLDRSCYQYPDHVQSGQDAAAADVQPTTQCSMRCGYVLYRRRLLVSIVLSQTRLHACMHCVHALHGLPLASATSATFCVRSASRTGAKRAICPWYVCDRRA